MLYIQGEIILKHSNIIIVNLIYMTIYFKIIERGEREREKEKELALHSSSSSHTINLYNTKNYGWIELNKHKILDFYILLYYIGECLYI